MQLCTPEAGTPPELKEKASVHRSGPMVIFIKDSGLKTSSMAKGSIRMLMEQFMTGVGSIIRLMVLER